MITLGYPVESALHPGKALIFKSPINMPSYITSDYKHPEFDVNKSRFCANAREFVPRRGMNYAQIKAQWKDDSGRGSGSASDSEEDLHNDEYNAVSYGHSKFGVNKSRFNGNAREIKAEWRANHHSGQGPGTSSDSEKNLRDGEVVSNNISNLSVASNRSLPNISQVFRGDGMARKPQINSAVVSPMNTAHEERKCERCGRGFLVGKNNEYLTQEECLYHWGKLYGVGRSGKHARMEYTCCKTNGESLGCTTGKYHVWSGLGVGLNGPLDFYVRTRPREMQPMDGNYGVYALDCEMCYTASGLELTKVTLIGADGRLVYESLVRPRSKILDYNTRFSGITAEDFNGRRASKTLGEVQNDLLSFLNANTILIGHGLENDLRALNIMHATVIDTAVAFPHHKGLPYRRSLKSLTSRFLGREIQQSAQGHNSYEDAWACMELMLRRVCMDFWPVLSYYPQCMLH